MAFTPSDGILAPRKLTWFGHFIIYLFPISEQLAFSKSTEKTHQKARVQNSSLISIYFKIITSTHR